MAEHPHTVAQSAICKCCGSAASLYGVVDFNKNCAMLHGPSPLPVAGIPVYYHRCGTCGFIFTIAFDHFTAEDFREFVYNDDYELVDPEYVELRPKHNAKLIAKVFGAHPDLRILDFGGGNGRFAEELRKVGFTSVEIYDPFVETHSRVPAGRFDLVLAFEVMEHSPDPTETIRQMESLLDPGGMILFSTLVQPAEIDEYGLNWWYAAPRNGHVSFYTPESIACLAEPYGLSFGSASDAMHVLCRSVPTFASQLIQVAA